jgi:hypothetical protein
MDWGYLLRRSWEIIWNNKFMFLLGFLAALGAGGGGNGGGRMPGFSFDQSDFEALPFQTPGPAIAQLARFWEQFGVLIMLAACLAIILGVFFWLVRLTAQGGLIGAAARLDAGETVTFRQAWGIGFSKLGRLLGINVLMYGIFFVLGVVAAALIFTTAGAGMMQAMRGNVGESEALFGGLGLALACLGLFGCLLLPLLLVVSVIYPFAQRAAILEDRGVMDSIRRGWGIVRVNLGDVVILVVLFIVIGILYGFAAALVLLPVGLISFIPGILRIVGSPGSIGVIEVLLLGVGGLVVGLLAAVLNSILISFRSTAVTLVYQQFTGKQPPKAMDFSPASE